MAGNLMNQATLHLLNNICEIDDLEFEDLYPIVDTIEEDKYETLILVDSVKTTGFSITDWGRWNWQHGPRIVSFTLSNGACDCQVDKLYYAIEIDRKYKVTERIKCRTAC